MRSDTALHHIHLQKIAEDHSERFSLPKSDSDLQEADALLVPPPLLGETHDGDDEEELLLFDLPEDQMTSTKDGGHGRNKTLTMKNKTSSGNQMTLLMQARLFVAIIMLIQLVEAAILGARYGIVPAQTFVFIALVLDGLLLMEGELPKLSTTENMKEPLFEMAASTHEDPTIPSWKKELQ